MDMEDGGVDEAGGKRRGIEMSRPLESLVALVLWDLEHMSEDGAGMAAGGGEAQVVKGEVAGKCRRLGDDEES